MDEIKAEVIKLSLDKMLNENGYFSICDLDKLGELTECNVKSSPHYKTLSSLHCVKYSKMSRLMKAEIPNMIMDCLTSSFDVESMTSCLAMAASNHNKKELASEKKSLNVFRIKQ